MQFRFTLCLLFACLPLSLIGCSGRLICELTEACGRAKVEAERTQNVTNKNAESVTEEQYPSNVISVANGKKDWYSVTKLSLYKRSDGSARLLLYSMAKSRLPRVYVQTNSIGAAIGRNGSIIKLFDTRVRATGQMYRFLKKTGGKSVTLSPGEYKRTRFIFVGHVHCIWRVIFGELSGYENCIKGYSKTRQKKERFQIEVRDWLTHIDVQIGGSFKIHGWEGERIQ